MADERARRLRATPTEAERALWRVLRTRKADGFHFRRQVPFGRYVADFACHGAKLAVEVDGGQHGTADNAAADAERTRWLEGEGYRVLRFWNTDVLGNIEGVMREIDAACTGRE